MAQPIPRETPDLWIRIWVGIGIAALLFFMFLPFLAFSYISKELDRKQACQGGQTEGCGPSFIWALDEAVRQAENDALLRASNDGERRSMTSEEAPRVESVDVGGAAVENGWHIAPAGTELTITTVVTGDPSSVELYLIPKGTETAGVGTHVGTMTEIQAGTYRGTYTMPSGLLADLEIRAVSGPNEYGSMFVNLGTKE